MTEEARVPYEVDVSTVLEEDGGGLKVPRP